MISDRIKRRRGLEEMIRIHNGAALRNGERFRGARQGIA